MQTPNMKIQNMQPQSGFQDAQNMQTQMDLKNSKHVDSKHADSKHTCLYEDS